MTIIISTHRLSLLGAVDRLLLFDHGRLVADGPRDKVLALLQGKPTAASTETQGQPGFAQPSIVMQKPNAAV
jgi:ATP-binding cassette subfamily C protein LapB